MKIFWLMMITGAVLQAVSGSMDTSVFDFPVNLLVVAVVLYLAFAEWRKRKKRGRGPELSSRNALIATVSALIVSGIIILAFPQFPAGGTAEMGWFVRKFGLCGFTRSWLFGAVGVWTLIFLASYAIRKFAGRPPWKKPNAGAALTATGLWLITAGFFLGSPDGINAKVVSYENFATNIGGDATGRIVSLPVKVRTEALETTSQPDGTRLVSQAGVRLAGDGIDKTYTLRPEGRLRPYLTAGNGWIVTLDEESLPAGDEAGHCVVRLVRWPWYWVIMPGCIILLAGIVMLIIFAIRGRSENNVPGPTVTGD